MRKESSELIESGAPAALSLIPATSGCSQPSTRRLRLLSAYFQPPLAALKRSQPFPTAFYHSQALSLAFRQFYCAGYSQLLLATVSYSRPIIKASTSSRLFASAP